MKRAGLGSGDTFEEEEQETLICSVMNEMTEIKELGIYIGMTRKKL